MENLLLGKKTVNFDNENLPYTVMATSDRYAVCSRKLDKKEDKDLLEHEVAMSAYSSKSEAYKGLKDCPVYTILDFKLGIRGSSNMTFSIYNYFLVEDCKKIIQELESGTIEISRRNESEIIISSAS